MKPEFELDRRHHHIRNSIIIIHHHSHHHWHLVWISFASHCIFLVLWKNIEALLREYWLLLQLLICCSSNQFKHLKLVLESTSVAFVWRTIINPIFSLSCKLIVLRRQIRCKNGGLWTLPWVAIVVIWRNCCSLGWMKISKTDRRTYRCGQWLTMA